jgi:hypothetical protein
MTMVATLTVTSESDPFDRIEVVEGDLGLSSNLFGHCKYVCACAWL